MLNKYRIVWAVAAKNAKEIISSNYDTLNGRIRFWGRDSNKNILLVYSVKDELVESVEWIEEIN